MILTNIKNKQKESGFTIVELLVVIVVIGILAAITIVSYTGITAKANTTKALSNANSLQQIAETMNAENGYYPDTGAHFDAGQNATGVSGTTKIPGSINLYSGQDGANGTDFTGSEPLDTDDKRKTGVTYACYLSCTASTGGRITYWDFTGTPGPKVVYVGAASASSTGAFFGIQ